MKFVYILRGRPGCGKSFIANQLFVTAMRAGNSAIICCADDYFTDAAGNYNWDAEKIVAAHSRCKYHFGIAISNSVDIVIVANTSTKTSDVNYYRNLAIDAGYVCFVLTVENWHDGKDIHNVPEETKEKMRTQLIKSIKL